MQDCAGGSVAEGLLAWNKQLFITHVYDFRSNLLFCIYHTVLSTTISTIRLTKTAEQELYRAGEEVLAE